MGDVDVGPMLFWLFGLVDVSWNWNSFKLSLKNSLNVIGSFFADFLMNKMKATNDTKVTRLPDEFVLFKMAGKANTSAGVRNFQRCSFSNSLSRPTPFKKENFP